MHVEWGKAKNYQTGAQQTVFVNIKLLLTVIPLIV